MPVPLFRPERLRSLRLTGPEEFLPGAVSYCTSSSSLPGSLGNGACGSVWYQ